MANLMITTFCNFNCDYCFGLDLIGPGKPGKHMTWETFLTLMDWIDAGSSPGMDIHLMGGEPTLNPRFADFFRELVRRGRRVLVFSNASTGVDLEAVEESKALGVNWVVNCNPPEKYAGGQLEHLRRNLEALGRAATLTFNITSGDMPYQFALDHIQRHDLNRAVKVGIALPTMQHNNVFVPIEVFGQVAGRVVEFARDAHRAGIEVEFECGVPYCLFSEEQLQELQVQDISHCGSRLDITPDGQVINCLPLAKMASHPHHLFASYGQALEWFNRALAPYRGTGAGTACHDCQTRREGLCCACLAYGLGQFNRIVLPPLPGKGCCGNQTIATPGFQGGGCA